MDEETLSNQEAAISLLSKFLLSGYFPDDSLRYIAENSKASAVLHDFQLTHPEIFDKLVNHIDLSQEEKGVVSAFVNNLISQFKNFAQHHRDRSTMEIPVAISSVSRRQEQQNEQLTTTSRKFSEDLVSAWAKNLKTESLRNSIEQHKNTLVQQSETVSSPSFIQQSKGNISSTIDYYTNAALDYVPESERETARKDIEEINTSLINNRSEAINQYREELSNSYTLQHTKSAMFLEATKYENTPSFGEESKENYVNLEQFGKSYALLASNNSHKESQELLRKHAFETSRVVSVLEGKDYADGPFPSKAIHGGVVGSINELRGLTPQQQAQALSEIMSHQITNLINDDSVLTQMGVKASPLINAIQSEVVKTSKTSSSTSGLSKIVGDVVGSVSSNDKNMSPSFIYGIQATNKAYIPWAKNVQNPLSTEGALFGMWLSLSSDDTIGGIATQLKASDPQSPFHHLSEQIKQSTEAMEIFNSIHNIRFVQKAPVYTPSVVFKMYLAKLFGSSSDFSFTQITGLLFDGKGFKLAMLTKGSLPAVGSSVGLVTKGALSGGLSKVGILVKGTNPVGWALLGIQVGLGILNKGLSKIGLSKYKISPVNIAIFIILIVLFIPLLFTSHTGITNLQIAQNVGGGPNSGGPAIICAADDPSCQPCDQTTGDCRWPVNNGCITQSVNGGHSHQGVQAVDIGSSPGTPVTAPHDGTIIFAYFGDKDNSGKELESLGYGNHVKLSGIINGRNIVTVYGHLSAINEGRRVTGESFVIQRDVSVSTGDIIGYVDNTGNTTGTHLHYELQGGLPLQVIFPFISLGQCAP